MGKIIVFLLRVLSGSQKLIPVIDACIAQVEKAKGNVLSVPDLPQSDNERLIATYPLVVSLTRLNDENFLKGLGKLEKSLVFLRMAILLFRSVSGKDDLKISDSKVIALIQARYMALKGKKQDKYSNRMNNERHGG